MKTSIIFFPVTGTCSDFLSHRIFSRVPEQKPEPRKFIPEPEPELRFKNLLEPEPEPIFVFRPEPEPVSLPEPLSEPVPFRYPHWNFGVWFEQKINF